MAEIVIEHVTKRFGDYVAVADADFTIAQGDRARLFGLNIIGLRRGGFDDDMMTGLREAYRELFGKGVPLRIALERVRETLGSQEEVAEMVRFIEHSRRGICRAARVDTPSG